MDVREENKRLKIKIAELESESSQGFSDSLESDLLQLCLECKTWETPGTNEHCPTFKATIKGAKVVVYFGQTVNWPNSANDLYFTINVNGYEVMRKSVCKEVFSSSTGKLGEFVPNVQEINRIQKIKNTFRANSHSKGRQQVIDLLVGSEKE
jgi:hypothetical protein